MRLLFIIIAFAIGCDDRDAAVRAVTEDPPQDPKFPAAMEAVQIPTHNLAMNGVLYVASGPRAHPAVLFLHGFPGNEQNLDLAQAMRRSGWSVLTMHYRGSWGSPGAFSFTTAIEDAHAAVAFLRDPKRASKFRIDPAKIVVIGHSMGGFIAAKVAGDDPAIAGVGLIAPWNIGEDAAIWTKATKDKLASEAEQMRADTLPLAGTSAEALIQEAIARGPDWDFATHEATIGKRPALVITTDDGGAPGTHSYAQALRAHARVTEQHFATDHSLSDKRIGLQISVTRWLSTIR